MYFAIPDCSKRTLGCPADCFREDVEYLVQSALDGYPACIVAVMDHHPESDLEVETTISEIAVQVFLFFAIGNKDPSRSTLGVQLR